MPQRYYINNVRLINPVTHCFFLICATNFTAYAGHADILSGQLSGQCSEPDGKIKGLDLKKLSSEGTTERIKHNTVLGKTK